MSCHLTRTTAATHRLIDDNLEETPVYGGWVDSAGPRYCPSIEDKIVRFKDKDSHQVRPPPPFPRTCRWGCTTAPPHPREAITGCDLGLANYTPALLPHKQFQHSCTSERTTLRSTPQALLSDLGGCDTRDGDVAQLRGGGAAW